MCGSSTTVRNASAEWQKSRERYQKRKIRACSSDLPQECQEKGPYPMIILDTTATKQEMESQTFLQLWNILGLKECEDEWRWHDKRAREVIEAVKTQGWDSYHRVCQEQQDTLSWVSHMATAVVAGNRERAQKFQGLHETAHRMLRCEQEVMNLMDQGVDVYERMFKGSKLMWQT